MNIFFPSGIFLFILAITVFFIIFYKSPRLGRNEIILLLSLSLPISILSGPFLPDLTVVLLTLFILSFFFNSNYKFYENKYLIYFFSIFYIYILFSSLISDDYFFSFHSSLPYIRFLFFVLAIKYIVDQKEIFSKYLFYLLFFIFFLLFSDSVYFFINDQSFLNMQNSYYWETNRFHSIMHDRTLGSYIVRLLPLLLAIYIKFFVRSDFILIIIIAMACFVIFLTGERAAIVMLFIFLSLFPLALDKKKVFNFYLILSSFSLFFISLLYYLKSGIFYRIFGYTFSQIVKSNNSDLSLSQFFLDLINFDISKYEFYIFSPSHQKLFFSAIEIFKDNLFFGGGPRMYRLLCLNENYFFEGSCNTHPHNFYVQFLAELGIIGFSFFLIIFFYIAYLLFKFIYNKFINQKLIISNSQYVLLLGFFITLWPLNTHGNFFNNLGSIFMFYPLGFYLSNRFSTK